MLTIHRYLPQATCEYSGRTAEAVEISTADANVQHAVISLAELAKLLRFRHLQDQKQAATPPSADGETNARS